MTEEIPIISTKQYIVEASQWLDTLQKGESVSVSFIPKTDRYIRMGQLLNDEKLMEKVLGKKRKYIFQRLNFDAHDAEDIDDLQHQLTEHLNFSRITPKPLSFHEWVAYMRKHDARLVYIIPDAEKFLLPESKHVLSLLSEILDLYHPHILTLLFFESDILHPVYTPVLPASPRIYDNVFRYPLYSEEETRSFIRMLAGQWHVSLSQKTELSILEGCGGHFWLAKEAMREYVAKQHWSWSDVGMSFRIRMVYDQFSDSEKAVLKKSATGESDVAGEEEKYSQSYLTHMRVLDSDMKLLLGVFREYLLNQSDITSQLSLKSNHIVLNNIPLHSFLSKKEYRVFKCLIEKRNAIVTREDIARSMWPTDTDNQYSDWAIDQIVARLRKRMRELSVDPAILQTVRGKGYRLVL